MDGVAIPRADKFKYLGSIIEENGNINEDINQRIIVGWQKWRSAFRILCDKKIPARVKGMIYRITVRPILLYGSEC